MQSLFLVLILFVYSQIYYAAVVEFLLVQVVGDFHTRVLLLCLPYSYPYHPLPFLAHLPTLAANAECLFWTLTCYEHSYFLLLLVLFFGCSSHDIKIFFHQDFSDRPF
jgi:hypothetical protein